MMDAAEIARLREINEKATPGPWCIYSEAVTRDEAKTELVYQVDHTEPFVGRIFLLNAGGKCPATTGVGPTSEANAAYIATFDPPTTRALLDAAAALEQARKERNTFKMQLEEQLSKASGFKGRATRAINDRRIAENQRDAAQQDAKEARALLGEAFPYMQEHDRATDAWNEGLGETRARIEAMLEKKL